MAMCVSASGFRYSVNRPGVYNYNTEDPEKGRGPQWSLEWVVPLVSMIRAAPLWRPRQPDYGKDSDVSFFFRDGKSPMASSSIFRGPELRLFTYVLK